MATFEKIGFIGVGNMGGALAQAVIRSIGAEHVMAADKNEKTLQTFCAANGCVPSSNTEVIRQCDCVFLGIKPQFLQDFAAENGVLLKARNNGFTLVSMLAGTPIQRLWDAFGTELPIIRIMPNTPVAVGQGMILYHPAENVSKEAVQAFTYALRFAGKADAMPEKLIDAGCAVSGCGPAFAYMFIDAMADAGVALGLTKKQAVLYAAQTLLGSAEMALSGQKSPADLKDAVCSPGGSTIAGVKALEKDGFRYAVIDAVTEAYKKTTQL